MATIKLLKRFGGKGLGVKGLLYNYYVAIHKVVALNSSIRLLAIVAVAAGGSSDPIAVGCEVPCPVASQEVIIDLTASSRPADTQLKSFSWP